MSSPPSLAYLVYGKESGLSPVALHILNHREWRGGSHDADIGRRLQTTTPELLQAPKVRDQIKG